MSLLMPLPRASLVRHSSPFICRTKYASCMPGPTSKGKETERPSPSNCPTVFHHLLYGGRPGKILKESFSMISCCMPTAISRTPACYPDYPAPGCISLWKSIKLSGKQSPLIHSFSAFYPWFSNIYMGFTIVHKVHFCVPDNLFFSVIIQGSHIV